MSTLSSQIANLSPEQLAKLAYELKASKAKKASKQPEIPTRVPGDPCPLSFAQQRLWFIAQLEPDSPFYNCIETLRMTGKLNVPLLEQVFNEVLRRHDTLRTTFQPVAGEPVQIVSSEIKLDHRVIDLEGLPASERERQVSKLAYEEHRRLFDLARGPLLRVVVLRITEHEHAILFSTHHIVSDGWSRDVLIREILDLYLAFVEGRPSPLAELPFQYADFAIWQRERLTGPVLEGHLEYWKRHLAGAPQVLPLPTDHPRPVVLTRRGAYETLLFSPELSHSLRTLGRRKGVTLFMTLLAGFDVLLSRYSGQTDFLVGTDIANRDHGTTESLIGFFVNQLVLRVDLAGDPTFNELLERVKEVTLNGYAHQDAPFEKVVDMLNPQRNLSHAPLFQVKLVLQYASKDNFELPELAIGDVGAGASIAKLDLTLIIDDGDPITAVIEYSTDLFESSTIRRMLAQFERLLALAVTDPDQHISELELLSSAERHQLLVEFNDTHVPNPHFRCIHELFEEQVKLAPDAPALTFQRQHLSYADLNSRANQLAHYLRQLGVKTETPVGVCLNRSIEMVVALLAILKAGGAYVPLDPEYPTERLAFILEDVSLPLMLTHSSIIHRHSSLVGETRTQTLCLDAESELWSTLPTTDLPHSDSSSDRLAYIMYTSGSTGQPKGVTVTHRAVHNLVRGTNYISLDESDVVAQVSNNSFDAATFEVWGALLSGARLVIIEKDVALAPHALAAQLDAHGVTVMFLTTALFNHMARELPTAFRRLRHLLFGGELVEPKWVREVLEKGRPQRLLHVYGPTETTTFATWQEVTSVDEQAHSVPIGGPLTNVQIYVLDEHLRPVPAGVPGGLYIGGCGLARGYHNEPELTAERFVPHPFSSVGGERLYRTGDYVRWGTEGALEFVGRVDTQVKIRGYRIEPGEVEAVLGQHASVGDCAVVMRQESDGQKYLMAYVVAQANGQRESTFELRAYLRQRLPEFMIPAAIVTLESLPLTANGKVDRRELAAWEVHVGSDRPYVPPRTTTEEMLCDIWQEVLHAERVGIEDNFFDLGGDSILTIQVIAKARAAGLELKVRQLFQYQTVHELAQEIESAQESSAPLPATAPFSLISEADRAALPAGVVDAYPLTAMQAGMLFHSELDPEAGLYHDIFSFHLQTRFDGEALQAALQRMIDQHPVLRTSFNLSDFSEPLQLVHEKVAVPLRIGDLRALSPTEQEEYLAQWLAAEKRHHFDWRHVPLLRFQIERRSEKSFQFSFTFHHAILDGWSLATMLTELFNDYSRQTDKHASAVPLGASFRDFVAAERAMVHSEKARRYWATMLSEAPHSRLPRLRESAGPSRVAGHSVPISPELSLQLKELARTAGVPLKSVLLAAHLKVLKLVTGGKDVLTGIASHGRPETADGERVLGLFLNTLPFRQELSGGTWVDLIQKTFQVERELLPFRRYPMAQMQQDLGNDTPLFEVLFNFVHFHVYDELQNVSGLEVLGLDGVADTNFTLEVSFALALESSQIGLELRYDAAELSAEQIDALSGYYERTLLAMATNPREQYDSCQLLSEAELRRQLEDWNHRTLPFPHTRCIHQLFAEQVAATPNAIALQFADQQLTYAQLNERAGQLAVYLGARGVGIESVVGVMMERSPDMIVSLLGLLKAGGAYLPLDPDYPRERLAFMLQDAAVRTVLTHRALSHHLPQTEADVICLDEVWTEISTGSKEDPERWVSPDNLAYITYTSGSTGYPKGVQVVHRGVVRLVKENDYAHLGDDEVCLQFAPLAFDASTFEIWGSLLNGGRLVIMPPGPTTLAELGQALKTYRVTVLWLTAGLFNLMVDEELDDLRGLRQLLAGGDALSVSHVERFLREAPATKLINGYGPTENTTFTCCYSMNTAAEFSHSIPIGRPIANTQVYILDENLRLVATGARGELYTGGDGLARGYLNHPELTAERFVPHPFSSQRGARLYRTGDWARFLPGGDIEFLGRVDNQAKVRGFRIEPGEIEAVLRAHQQVREAAVVLKEADGDKQLVAYVVSDAQTNELREYLKERLPDYMVPSFFVHLNEIPLTPHGKLDRHALPEPEIIFAEEAEYEAPRTPTEELLSGLWASVLRVSRVGINDNFFELGGHSLLAIQLISRIREALGVELPLRELFERRNVAELAQSVDDLIRANHEMVVPPLYAAIREGVLPLSFAQQRLWFLDQLVPENIAYNVADALRLRGELNHAALEQSINEIMRRHEAVRTIFPEVDGNPIQVITPFRPVDLPLVDLSSLSDEEREAQAVRLGSAEAQRPFNLQSGPLLRVTLLRLGAEDHVLLFSMHHIITDEWSTTILTSEVEALYDAFTTGNASPLPELAIQYGDYAVWQRQWLAGDVLARQVDYWTSKLQGVPALFALPTDYPRPKVQLTEGALCTYSLSAELTSDLKALAQQSNATLYMTIMAAFHALLHRYAQQTTVVTGTVVTNRPRVETEPLIGFFVNTLAIRSDFDDDPTFVTYLSRLRKHALEAYAHRDLPFEMLVDELQLARDLSYHPLFQVMFSWEEPSLDQLNLTGLELGLIEVENHTAQFDLTLRPGEFDGRLRCTMQYNTALFEASTIRRMQSQFERLLASVVSNPEQHISELELLSSAEKQQLLVELNDTHVPYPHTRCIHELFEEQVALAPEAPALTFDGEHVSYAELNSRANQLAHYLRQLGVKTEMPVGVCLNRSIEMVVAVLAILKAGGVYIPLDPEYPTERLAFILDDVAPPIILTDSTLVDEVPSTWAQPLCLDTESEFWSDLPTIDLDENNSSSDNLAYVMYTSGSTGNPKGVAVPHRAVVRLVKQSAYVDFGCDEVFLQLAPVTFDASTLEIWGALLNGGRLVLMPPGGLNMPELGTVLRSEAVTVLWLTAGLFHLMVEQELESLAGVTQVVAGGDVLSAEHVRRLLRAKGGSGVVVNGYGPTETTTFACCHRMSGETELKHGVPIGSPIGNTLVYVLGEKMELVGPGMLGELYIGGDGLARGYYNHPGLTAERFVPHPFSTAGDERLYRTGDYVRWRADETLEFVGRRDTQVKIRGYRVEPGEVEAVLGQHGSVRECAVVTRTETSGEKRLVAYVVDGDYDRGINAFELREYLRERLPEFMLPSAIVELESLPLTPNGKVDRRELAAREVHVGGDRSYVPPRTTTEELLCGVWAEVLRAERVGIEDNFFDLGGDSILTIQVIVKARALGLELTVQQLFQHQTISELAQAIQLSDEYAEEPQTEPFSLISAADHRRLPAGVVDAYPLTAMQAGMLFHSELVPEAGLYHDIFSFHLRLPFDGEAIEAELQRLIDLHPVLRTSFNLSDFSEPLQLVHEKVAVPLWIGDLRALSPMEQEEYLAQWLAAEKRHHFDWRQVPLLRFQIERRSEESFQFSFSFHHAILDGWSVATLLTELFNVYSGRETDERASEPPVSASFRDFVAAERAILESDEARQYWSTMLSDSTQTRLPRLGEAGPIRVAASEVELSPELFDGLKGLARTAGVPIKSVLLAAHLRVLSLLSGCDDVLTGVVSHGRTETKDSKRVLGLFLNTLPFRQKLSGGTWLELVQETFQAERELLPFRRYPMARVQQDVGNNAPLFEVVFNFVHFHVYEEMQNEGVEVLGYDGSADTNYALAVDFHLVSGGAGIVLGLEYDTSQLSKSQIEAALHYYLTTLEEMARTPMARYEQQCLLSQEERRIILHEWNEPAPPKLYNECYHNLFEAQVARTPYSLAAVLDGEQLTYEALNQRANQLAHYLRGLGVAAEVPVGVLLDRSLETIVTLLAILKAGGVYVPLDTQQPAERQQYVVDDAGLALLLTHTKFKDVLPSGVRGIYLDSERHTIAEQSTANVASAVDPSNLAYVIYTSGSTGRPKGVGVPHEVIVSHCLDIREHYELQPSDRVLVFSSFSFDVSLEEMLPTLLTGASLVVRDENVWTPKEFVQALAEQHITVVNLSTAYWHNLTQDCVAAGDFDTTYDLRLACIGGEALLPETVRLWQSSAMRSVRLLDVCGPTETIVTDVSFAVPTPLPGTFPLPTIPIGRPLATRTAYILDSHGNPAPVGVPGEWHVGGPVMARGYLNRPDLTAEKFIPDVFSDQPGARLYCTGDLARYLPDGNIEFLGRIDQQVKLRGFRIELGEIEAVLKQHASVREAVVVLHEAQRLIAYVQLRAMGEVEASELRAYLKERLPEYMIPAAFVEVAEFALTPNGKMDRRALPAPEGILAEEAQYEAPRTPTEELLSGLWASVLRVSRVGINDNFFELGGHSLLATQLVSRVRETFGVELPLRELFERPTVAGLAEQVEAALRDVRLTAPPLVPVSREQQLSLSFAQQRLWFLDQLEPSGSFYNLPAAVRLRGVLNVAALEQTLSEVVRRHEALRTTFVAVDGEPRQVINPFTPITLPIFDVSELDTAEREVETRRLLSEDASRPFDLARGPLVRACLVRLGAEEHVALVTMHHIISDGWSTGIFIREVAALYKAFLAGEESSLAELPIQYADFAHWQRNWLQGEVLAAQLDYWREALAEMPAMLDLPTDRPRPPEATFNGAEVSLALPAELTSQLKALSQRERVTLFMTLLAAFQSLLFRHSGQDDIVVGTPIANRRYRELEDLNGFFVNTLALRARSIKALTFIELLHRVREVTLAAYAHQDLPFERVVEELQPERDLSRNPLFQVNFALQNAPFGVLELPGLTLQEQELDMNVTRFDLECHLWEDGELLRGLFIYNTDLFDHTTIQRMVVNFETLLHSIVANPAEAVASLRLLSPADEQQLLYGWNETSVEFPQAVVHELFERQVERTPYDTAVVFEDVSLTFLELNRRGNRLAAYLQTMGVGPDTVVGVMLERSVEMLVGVLGVLKAGGAYLPLDPAYPAERLEFMLADAAVRVVLTQEKLLDVLPPYGGKVISLDRSDASYSTYSEENPNTITTPQNLAYVIYTSGSTGKPKGVAMTHRPLVNLLHWQMRRSANAPRTLQFASLSFDVSFQEIFSTLGAGGTLVLLREETRRDARALWQLLIRERIERLFLPFVALQYLAEAAEREEEFPATLREVIPSGEQLKITRHIRRLFAKLDGCTLDNQCGPSETHAVVGFLLPASVKDWTALPPIGRPLSNVRLYVLDKHMRPVPAGAPGTLYIAGDCLSRGYLDRPDLTADRYVPNPFSERGERLYRSGDIVRYLPAGDVEWLRREDDQVKIRGFRVELGEVETALTNHTSVREAVVIARVESREEKRLVAYVVSEDGVEVEPEELRQTLRAKLPEYMVPSAIVVLEELPLTPSGKINRRALPAPESIFAQDEAPRTPTEELLLRLWATVLEVSRVGINDNFFELGGHSLLATQLVSRVRETFGVELPLRELFAHPTVAGLAEQVEIALGGGMRVAAPPIVPVSREQQLPLSHAQERLWFLDQLESGSVAYNVPAAVRLKGRLEVEALLRTLNEVVRRHEVLRTTFVAVNGAAVQVISPASQVEMPVLDLSKLPEEKREAEARQLAAAEALRPFDLSVGPLLRVQLLQLGAADHVLLFTMHHIITDGWSTGILVREMEALYKAYTEGREAPLPELEIQYADYAVWQREWLQGEVLDQQLGYWRRQLGGELPVLQLPTDRPRPPLPSYRGRSFNFTLPAGLTIELKELSNAEGVTLYMTLLAAFKILLWRYSGQSDVVVGTPIAGRNHLATEGLIGLFVNTLVLRTDLSGNPSFSELLDRVREVTLGAYAHQDLPFEKLVEELQPERDLSRSPLFQVMFVLQNTTAETVRLPGLETAELAEHDETAKFDLTLGLGEVDGQLQGSLQYNTDLFDAATIERLVQHYQLLLEDIATHPDRQLSQLPLLLDADRHKLSEWNNTRVEYDLEKCVHQLFEAQAKQTPDAAALVAGQVRLSYGELESRAEKLARRLRREGVGPEQRVGLLVGRGAAMVVAVLGVLKAGGAYVALDPDYPRERLRFMIEDAGVTVLLTQPKLLSILPETEAAVLFVDERGQATLPDLFIPRASQKRTGQEEGLAPAAENLAYVIYTSGSTGRPKGVAITHRSAVAFIHWARDVFPPFVSRGVLASTSLSFDLSVFELFVTLSSGGKVVLADNALHLPTLEAAHEVTLINTVPSAMAELLRIDAVPDSVRTINLAGEALSNSLVQQIYEQTGTQQIWNLYGPSEDTTYSTAALIEKNQSGPMVIGRPVANTQAYICDETLQLLPVGVAGQLLLAGDGLARGYIGRPDLTAERFLPNPFSTEAGARLYVTGDLARYRADGQIEFLGRADSQLKLRGFRIEPGEIETRLREHPALRDAIVIATTEVDKRLVAYVVPAQSGANVNELRDYVREKLPEYMVPSAFVLMDAFPLSPNGKIDRRALPLPDQSATDDSEFTAPRDVFELQLSQIWKEVLRREQIGLRDNFFDLGGHSLLAVRLIDKIERLVEQKIPLSILFQGATIEQLAATLRQRGEKVSEQSLVSIQPEGSRPPLYLVHSASGNAMSYVALARRLGREQPVYGLQSKGLDPDRKPTARVEDMASEYLEELFAVQPDGPYFLGGWSMGGVIAFEMARQLTAQGKSVAPLVIIDSSIQTGRVKKNGWDDVSLLLALAQHHGLFLDDSDQTFADLRSLSLDEQLEFLLEKAAAYSQLPLDLGIPQLRHLFELFKVNVHASERYRPKKSEQQIILLQAADAPRGHAGTALRRWEKVAEVVEAQRLPGDHYTLLTEPNVTLLAEQINSLLSALS